jgi:tetrahydromethanopterin S-methyltransferase subunit F
MLGGAGVLAAVGSLFGAAVGLGIAGLFIGLVLGLVLVFRRFRDL